MSHAGVFQALNQSLGWRAGRRIPEWPGRCAGRLLQRAPVLPPLPPPEPRWSRTPAASNSAVRSPTKRMPRPISTRARPAFLERSISSSRAAADFSAKRSRATRSSFFQAVEIGDAVHQAAIEQLLHDGIAQAFDVHDAAAAKVEQALAQLGGAVGVDAAVVDFAFDADDFAVALRAMRGKDETADSRADDRRLRRLRRLWESRRRRARL